MENRNKKDILVFEDIQLLVNTFYTRVRGDELLGPVFEERLSGRWEKHLDKMYSFWQTVLLQELTYKGAPFPKHMKLPVEQAHFDRWLKLFYETIDAHFQGDKADELKMRSRKMADMFMMKINFYRQNPKNYIQ